MRVRVVLAGLAAVVLVTPMLARAEHVEVADSDDVNGALDIEIVEVLGAAEPAFRIETYEGWSTKRIFDKGFFFVYFDTFAGPRFDYFALVTSNGSDVDAVLIRDRRTKPDRELATLPVAHNSRREVSVVVPLEEMRFGESRLTYIWYVASTFTNKACSRVCIDRAPDEGGVEEPLPVPSPTPSP